jgi:hypothetical protein
MRFCRLAPAVSLKGQATVGPWHFHEWPMDGHAALMLMQVRTMTHGKTLLPLLDRSDPVV